MGHHPWVNGLSQDWSIWDDLFMFMGVLLLLGQDTQDCGLGLG